MKRIEMLTGAKRLVEVNAGLKPNERVLIVCDPDNIPIGEALAYVVKCMGADYTFAVMAPRSTHGEDPTDAISNAMLGADVVFAPTRYSLSHSKAREKANQSGVRFISMPDYSEEMMKGGALEADFLGIYKTVIRLKNVLTKSQKIRITAPSGTDITLVTEGRIGNEVSGVCREAGTWGSPPNIEVNVSPVEDKTEGVVVVDGSIPTREIGLLQEPVRLEIRGGKIVSFSGGMADILRKVLDGTTHPENLVLAEFGIGLNDRATLKGNMLEDEGAYGTAHFGFGHNFDQGGQNIASKHIDAVYRRPTVVIDGVTVMVDGKLTDII